MSSHAHVPLTPFGALLPRRDSHQSAESLDESMETLDLPINGDEDGDEPETAVEATTTMGAGAGNCNNIGHSAVSGGSDFFIPAGVCLPAQGPLKPLHARRNFDRRQAPSIYAQLTARVIFLRLLLLCAGFLGFGINLYALVERYLEEPVLTTYKAKHTAFKWPDITFCNPNNPIMFWNNSHLEPDWDGLLTLARRFSNLSLFANETLELQAFAMSSLDPVKYDLANPENVVYSVAVESIASSISSSTGYYKTMVSIHNYPVFFSTRMVAVQYPIPCYTFNPADMISQSFSDDHSLNNESMATVYLDILMDRKGYIKFNSSYEDRHVYVYLTVPSQTILSRNFYYIIPGSTNEVRMTMNHLQRLQSKSRCIDETFKMEIYDARMSATHQYTGGFDDCKYYISQLQFLSECRCYSPFLPIFKTEQVPPRLCFNMTLYSESEIIENIACLRRVLDYYSRGQSFEKKVHKRCSRYHQPLCNQISYKFGHGLTVWTSDINENRRSYMKSYANTMANNPSRNQTDEFLRQNLAEIKLYREVSRADMLIEEFEYPLSRFMSDIGGIMGMWLGFSVIGMYEFAKMCLSLSLRMYHFRA